MLITVALGFVAGFFLGNGLPYYTQGSTGEGRNPGPFPDSPVVSVFSGWGAFVVAAIAWNFAQVSGHPLSSYTAAALGVLAVGLVHTRTWRSANPWGKRAVGQERKLPAPPIRRREAEDDARCPRPGAGSPRSKPGA